MVVVLVVAAVRVESEAARAEAAWAHPLRVEELRLVDRRVTLRDHHEHVVAGHGSRSSDSGLGAAELPPIDRGETPSTTARAARGVEAVFADGWQCGTSLADGESIVT